MNKRYACRECLYGVFVCRSGSEHVIDAVYFILEIIVRAYLLAVESNDAVTFLNTCFQCRRIRHNGVDCVGNIRAHKLWSRLKHAKHVDFAWQVYGYLLSVSYDVAFMSCAYVAEHVG